MGLLGLDGTGSGVGVGETGAEAVRGDGPRGESGAGEESVLDLASETIAAATGLAARYKYRVSLMLGISLLLLLRTGFLVGGRRPVLTARVAVV